MHLRTGLALGAACALIGGCGRPPQSAAPAPSAVAAPSTPAVSTSPSGGSAATDSAAPATSLPQPPTQAVPAAATAQDRGKPELTHTLTKEEESSGMPMAGQVNNHSTLDGNASTPASK